MSTSTPSAWPLWTGVLAVSALLAGGGLWYANQSAGPDAPTEPAVQVAVAQDAPAQQPPAQQSPAQQLEAAPELPAPTETARVEPPQTPEPAQTPEVAPEDPPAPRLDEVRLDQEGVAVIAGRASPFAEVVLRADGAEIGRAAADARGAFATVTLLEPSADGRLLTLAEIDKSGSERPSPDELILAPVRAAAPVDMSPSIQAELAAQPDVPAVPTRAETSVPDIQQAPTLPAATRPDATIAGQQKVAILRSGPDGVDVVQPLGPTPDVMSRIALDSISYSATGEVQLRGRAQSEAREVIVYLDNRPVAALTVEEDGGWRGDVPNVDSGIYTLRIDELTADGRVASRVETPFKREEPEALFAAVDDEKQPVQAITVQAGATLWAIARDRYGDGTLYVQVFEANRDAIRDPDLIYPGQVFALPKD